MNLSVQTSLSPQYLHSFSLSLSRSPSPSQRMFALRLHVQTTFNYKSFPKRSTPSSSSCSSTYSIQLGFRDQRSRSIKSILISCKAFDETNFITRSTNDDDDDYIQAVVMVPETVKHYHLRGRGFLEQTRWNTGLLHPYSYQAEASNSDFSSFGHEFLRRFQNATIFLKIACDGDLILPIIIGDFTIEKFIDSLNDDDDGDFPDEFQLVKNVVARLGYEVKMVRITKRIVNTYYARIFFSKPGDKAILSVDARPSDAINVAKRCRVPIYVNKQIVLTDAIVYGTRRGKKAKSVYDVSLDSAEEGTNVLAEELHLVKSLNIAIREERYTDAAILRDKLVKLRTPRYEI